MEGQPAIESGASCQVSGPDFQKYLLQVELGPINMKPSPKTKKRIMRVVCGLFSGPLLGPGAFASL